MYVSIYNIYESNTPRAAPPFFDHYVDRKVRSIFMDPSEIFGSPTKKKTPAAASPPATNPKDPHVLDILSDPFGPSPPITVPSTPPAKVRKDDVSEHSPVAMSAELQEMAENTLFLFDDMQRYRVSHRGNKKLLYG